MKPIDELKMLLREREVPFFTENELTFHLNQAEGDLRLAAYRLLLIKAENSTLTLSGMTLPDTSDYWRRLAHLYRPNGTCVMGGG